MSLPRSSTPLSRDVVDAHGPWFQNFHIDGIQTAPGHPLGNYPDAYFRRFAHAFPTDLTGWSVLEIGCNAGFYAFEMKRRGAAHVVGIDREPLYLRQARLLADRLGLDVEFHERSVYDVGGLGQKFDLVLFMGVLYHLRHPLLALDLLYDHVVGDLMVFQSMMRGSKEVQKLAPDYRFWETDIFDKPGYPLMYFVERRYSHDPTNWWIPNNAAAEAMLRSAGFEIQDHPEDEVYICKRGQRKTLEEI